MSPEIRNVERTEAELMGLVEVGARKEDEEVLRLRGAAFSLHKRI